MTAGVEDIYALSPLQEGMLFHALLDPTLGEYVEQVSFRFDGALDARIFERAWQRVVDRTPALRTSFHWEGLETPVQVVHSSVRVPLQTEDLRFRAPAVQIAHIQQFLEQDRLRGFQLSQAPLLRLTLFRLGEHAYQLVITFHHAVLDGWSLNLVLQEFAACQDAFYRGSEPVLPARRPYADFIAWLEEQHNAGSELYWRRLLAGYKGSAWAQRASSNGTNATQTADIEVKLPASVTAELQNAARRRQLTLNTLVQGAWALVLGVWSNERDVVFGSVVSGRPPELDGVESMIGLFLNTLPVRVRTSPEQDLTSWLKRLQAQQMETRQHGYTPLLRIQQWSEAPRGVPLFESVLVFNNLPGAGASGSSNQSASQVLAIERLGYPISIVFSPGPQLTGRFQYMPSRVSRGEFEAIVRLWQKLIQEIAVDRECRIGDLSLVSDAEHKQAVVSWNNTAAPRTLTNIVEAFEAQAERSPAAVAVRDSAETVSYRELNRQANRISHYLRSQGARAESIVGVRMRRSASAVTAILGILKAGAAWLPLDPAYPPERLDWMVEDSGTRIVLTGDEPVGGYSDENPRNDWHPDRAAYVMYTSGSTGRPKGVVGLHGATMNRLEWMWRQFPWKPDSVASQKTALSFVDSVWELFGGLLAGVPTVIVGEDEDLAVRLSEENVTRVVVVPSVLKMLLETRQVWPRLTEWFVSGEELTGALVEQFRQSLPGARLVNLYGSSEVAGDVTWWAASAGPVAIGRPLSNTTLYVLDEALRPVPVGMTGELFAAGAGLARGYLHRGGLTAERFLPDPFGPGRMYRTGDLARWRSDGVLEYLGRRDAQVKLRGMRVELGEIESELNRHPAVRESAVSVQDGDILAAFFVPTNGIPEAAELKQYLGRKLPAYMVPSRFVTVPALPRTPNGKLDRQRLPRASGGIEAVEYVAPRTRLEQSLANLWSALLHVERVGIHDNFFELGGHSLLAMQLHSRIRETLRLDVSLQQILRYPTIAEYVEAALQQSVSKTDESTFAAIMAEIQDMSDEEVQRMLASGGGRS